MPEGKNYIGVGCGAHILDDQNRILLLKRNEGSRNRPGHWIVPGGKVDFGETVEDALKREVKEELGVEIEVVRLLCVANDIIKAENQHWVSPQFLCKITKGTPKNLELNKHDDMQWFALDDLPEKVGSGTLDGIKELQKII